MKVEVKSSPEEIVDYLCKHVNDIADKAIKERGIFTIGRFELDFNNYKMIIIHKFQTIKNHQKKVKGLTLVIVSDTNLLVTVFNKI